MLTMQKLCDKLGLQNPEEFEETTKQNYIAYPRRSGRTTRMLLNACLKAQKDKVYIFGHQQRYSRRLQTTAREMCIKAGIPIDNIVISSGTNSRIMNADVNTVWNSTPDVVFLDHYYGY